MTTEERIEKLERTLARVRRQQLGLVVALVLSVFIAAVALMRSITPPL